MAKNNNNYNHTELIWDGKFEEPIKLTQKRTIEKIVLPFQVIEVINEPREGTGSGQLFSGRRKEGWKNKLIWGDNKLVVSSLLKEYTGKINLIYIDPPFYTGTDQKIILTAGENNTPITKEPSMIEEAAYRNVWRHGAASYFHWFWEKLFLMRDLLANDGIIFIRHDQYWSHYVKVIADEVFGRNNFQNEIVVKRIYKNITQQGRISLPLATDSLFVYFKSDAAHYHNIYRELKETRESYWRALDDSSGVRKPPERVIFGKTYYPPAGKHFKFSQEKIDMFTNEGRIRINEKTGHPQYLVLETDKAILNSNWTDISGYSFTTGYPTENSEDLLERVIKAGSESGDLVADFFSGSGTTGAVAERLGRRWIMCDLGRFAIHTSRKRLMEVQRKLKESGREYYPFEILNLGKYERQHWQTAVVNGGKSTAEGKKIAQYVNFVIELYRGETVNGFSHLHGKKDNVFIHIGAVDAPVTMNEIKEAVEECKKNKFSHLDILGWEWEMGVNEEAVKWAKSQGIRLRLLQIPREVMDKKAVENGEVKFFELDYVEVAVEKRGQEVKVSLKNFAIPSDEYIPNELRERIENWSDYIDYWSVDWDYESLKSSEREPIFENDWQTFRTKKNTKLELATPWHKYSKKGKFLILVKVIDIFGNDTSKIIEVRI
ncbi:MAG: site-specific DNA-methyltransferase [Caldisericia bacterium]|nr:site-specific DNA-methyltransferase [Caldisericia bacterium]